MIASVKDGVKAYIDAGELNVVRFVFADALEVDPTFEKYEEAYEYCKSIPGVLDPYEERTPLRQDPATWDEDYWRKLKLDLGKNFADVRMCHMREVAKVILAEKIQRLRNERAAELARQAQKELPKPPAQPAAINGAPGGNLPTEEEEKRRIEKLQQEIEEHNQRIEAQQAAERRMQNGGNVSKKALGIAIAVGVGVAVLATVLILSLR
jgi:hypothetical protein